MLTSPRELLKPLNIHILTNDIPSNQMLTIKVHFAFFIFGQNQSLSNKHPTKNVVLRFEFWT